jgi:hypothetical protein
MKPERLLFFSYPNHLNRDAVVIMSRIGVGVLTFLMMKNGFLKSKLPMKDHISKTQFNACHFHGRTMNTGKTAVQEVSFEIKPQNIGFLIILICLSILKSAHSPVMLPGFIKMILPYGPLTSFFGVC